jgi:MFS transporter, DHA1 family, inner membrane transport protein
MTDTNAAPARAGTNTLALILLTAGNFVIGTGVLAPAAMMNDLVAAFSRGPEVIGTLITWGALVLFVGAPTLAFLTNKVDRRVLLVACMVVYAIGHIASSFAQTFDQLMGCRLAMIAGAAVFTPQAATTVGLLVPPEKRASSVTLVFLGWSIASAFGVPMLSLTAAHAGWHMAYLVLGIVAVLVGIGIVFTLPGGLRAPLMDAAAWRRVFTKAPILLILLVTCITVTGQFIVFPYLAAEMKRAAGAGPETVAALLGLYGVSGIIGGIVMSRLVTRIGPNIGALICQCSIVLGLLIWALTPHTIGFAALAITVWGLAFAVGTSLQQTRLINVAPELASASVALNTSVLYLGQAFGGAMGGALIASDRYALMGWAGAGFVTIAALLSYYATRRYQA